MREPITVEGYQQLMKDLREAEPATRRAVRDGLREGVQPVRQDAARRLERLSPKSAAHLGISVRARGVSIEQRLRRVSGKRPDWGATQMRIALLPAAAAKEGEVVLRVEQALETVTTKF